MYYDDDTSGRCLLCDARTNNGSYCIECSGHSSDHTADKAASFYTGIPHSGTIGVLPEQDESYSTGVAAVRPGATNPVRFIQEGNSVRHLPLIGNPPCDDCPFFIECGTQLLACQDFARYVRGVPLERRQLPTPATAAIYQRLFNSGDEDES